MYQHRPCKDSPTIHVRAPACIYLFSIVFLSARCVGTCAKSCSPGRCADPEPFGFWALSGKESERHLDRPRTYIQIVYKLSMCQILSSLYSLDALHKLWGKPPEGRRLGVTD